MALDKTPTDLTPPPRLLVASVGTGFAPGVREATAAACAEFKARGGHVAAFTQPNLCVMSHMALQATRNFILMRARQWRFDYVALVEDDVLMDDPTMLWRLVSHRLQVVSPWWDQSELVPTGAAFRHTLNWPCWGKGQGVKPLDWAVHSLVVIDTRITDLAGLRPFIDVPMYNVEEYQGLYLQGRGVRWWQDTDVSARLMRMPGMQWEYTFDRARMPADEAPEKMAREAADLRRLYVEAQTEKGLRD